MTPVRAGDRALPLLAPASPITVHSHFPADEAHEDESMSTCPAATAATQREEGQWPGQGHAQGQASLPGQRQHGSKPGRNPTAVPRTTHVPSLSTSASTTQTPGKQQGRFPALHMNDSEAGNTVGAHLGTSLPALLIPFRDTQ